MRLLSRQPKDIFAAVTDFKRYRTFYRMYQRYPHFSQALFRFLTTQGAYPFECDVRTPLGLFTPTLYSYHDLMTLNEAFCREDYPATAHCKVVVDLGSNIGLTGLYFLTRAPHVHCYLYEPVPRNVERLRHNLRQFSTRFEIQSVAVSDKNEWVPFSMEPTGRYGHISDADSKNAVKVECLHINDVLDPILNQHDFIDILKIDTEGAEQQTVAAIAKEFLPRIRSIYFEGAPMTRLLPQYYRQQQRWSVCQLHHLD